MLYYKEDYIGQKLTDGLILYLDGKTGNLHSRRDRDWVDGSMNLTKPPLLVDLYREMLISELGILDKEAERDLIQVGQMYEGEAVPFHQHRCLDRNLLDIRINTVLSRPLSGGLPIIRNKIYDMPKEGSLLMFNSCLEHGTTSVIGDVRRLVLSFGFEMSTKRYEDLTSTFGGCEVPVHKVITDLDRLKIF